MVAMTKRKGTASAPPVGIRKATEAYESWLARHVSLIPADLKLKHERMAQSPFPFLRATFYRWRQLWPEICPELDAAPKVLGVGDLHVENFGTWRDHEGRLIWGVNDFDEACVLPYTNDLVRLAASAQLAARDKHLSCDDKALCDALLAGYVDAIQRGGKALVLAERHPWLRDLAMSELRDPVQYWDKLERWRNVGQWVPRPIMRLLRAALPNPDLALRVVHRQAGLGSLGRQRFTAIAEWCGGLIAREAKELAPTAWHWEMRTPGERKILYLEAIENAIRVADPFVRLEGHWLIRRLAPDCSRIELSSLPKVKDELKLLHAMGWETANIHLGNRNAAKQVLKDLRKRPARWLFKAATLMAKAIVVDWKEWAAKSRRG